MSHDATTHVSRGAVCGLWRPVPGDRTRAVADPSSPGRSGAGWAPGTADADRLRRAIGAHALLDQSTRQISSCLLKAVPRYGQGGARAIAYDIGVRCSVESRLPRIVTPPYLTPRPRRRVAERCAPDDVRLGACLS
eukprot:6794805-Prymnesium_polylepis.1